nr:DUF4244 domain-containing protein [Glycomyces buryatensis]
MTANSATVPTTTPAKTTAPVQTTALTPTTTARPVEHRNETGEDTTMTACKLPIHSVPDQRGTDFGTRTSPRPCGGERDRTATGSNIDGGDERCRTATGPNADGNTEPRQRTPRSNSGGRGDAACKPSQLSCCKTPIRNTEGETGRTRSEAAQTHRPSPRPRPREDEWSPGRMKGVTKPSWGGKFASKMRGGGESGMSTAEYAVGTLAAVAFAGVLLKVLTSGTVQSALSALIERALS